MKKILSIFKPPRYERELLPLHEPLLPDSQDHQTISMKTILKDEFFHDIYRDARENAGRSDPGIMRQHLFFDMFPHIIYNDEICWWMPFEHAIAIMIEETLGYDPIAIIDDIPFGRLRAYDDNHVNECVDEIIHKFTSLGYIIVDDITFDTEGTGVTEQDKKEEVVEIEQIEIKSDVGIL